MLNRLILPRLVALRRTVPVSSFEIATTIVVERILDIVSLCLIGVVIWPFLPAGSPAVATSGRKEWADIPGGE